MSILNDEKFIVERAVIDGLILFEKAELVAADARAAIVRLADGDGYRAVFLDARELPDYAARYGVSGTVCVMNCGQDIIKKYADRSVPYRTYAYLASMPPSGYDACVRRLAPSLAGTVLEHYSNPGSYELADIEELMRRGNVFGAIEDGKLMGFIGLHSDGSMGMLEVFEPFRRRGVGERLERFLITYVMTSGRTPVCEVAADNAASLRLQQRIGLSAGNGYTVWVHME